jgi:hypothetical protein
MAVDRGGVMSYPSAHGSWHKRTNQWGCCSPDMIEPAGSDEQLLEVAVQLTAAVQDAAE